MTAETTAPGELQVDHFFLCVLSFGVLRGWTLSVGWYCALRWFVRGSSIQRSGGHVFSRRFAGLVELAP